MVLYMQRKRSLSNLKWSGNEFITTFVFGKQSARVVGRINVANDRSHCLTLVNKVTNLRFDS